MKACHPERYSGGAYPSLCLTSPNDSASDRTPPHSSLASTLRDDKFTLALGTKQFSARRGFTLVEVLVTVATLIILMGLAVSLAREVRRRSADQVTRELLSELDATVQRHQQRHAGSLPKVTALLGEAAAPEPATLARAARKNNEDFVLALRKGGGFVDDLFGKLPRSMYDDQTLRDAWGNPIVFMPAMHPAIGMADDNRPFFVSAGPDGNYLTLDDNLYSYEGR